MSRVSLQRERKGRRLGDKQQGAVYVRSLSHEDPILLYVGPKHTYRQGGHTVLDTVAKNIVIRNGFLLWLNPEPPSLISRWTCNMIIISFVQAFGTW